jgi:hypothetical protein
MRARHFSEKSRNLGLNNLEIRTLDILMVAWQRGRKEEAQEVKINQWRVQRVVAHENIHQARSF